MRNKIIALIGLVLFANSAWAVDVTIKKINEVDHKAKYLIEFSYPHIKGQKQFNAYVDKFVAAKINKFKKDIKAWEKDAKEAVKIGLSTPDSLNGLLAPCKIMNTDPNAISLYFLCEYDYRVGAHPRHMIYTLNYDLTKNKPIYITDVIENDPRVVGNVIDFSVKELIKQSKANGLDVDEEWVRNGVGKTLKNFSEFNIVKDGIIINFDEYKVSSYSEGPRQVLLPLSLFHRGP